MIQQKPWFKVFVWFLTTFFLFLASGVIISIFKPGPSQIDGMKFMSGMMSAMHNSIMGITMGVGHNRTIVRILATSYSMVVPTVAFSIAAGFAIRFLRRSGKSVR